MEERYDAFSFFFFFPLLMIVAVNGWTRWMTRLDFSILEACFPFFFFEIKKRTAFKRFKIFIIFDRNALDKLKA